VKVLVTGADGFVGRHLVRALRARGDIVEACGGPGNPGAVEITDPPAVLRRIQRFNVSVSLVIRQWMQVLVVSAGVGLFFVAFGMLAISDHIYQQWGIDHGSWSHTVLVLEHPVVISSSLVKVAVGIATFTGLYYSIALLTDATYRADFLESLTAELRELFSARTEYVQLRSAQVSQSVSGPMTK